MYLEIGAARVEHGEVTAQYETFVNPGVGIPEKVRELTGINDEMVKDAPRISEDPSGFYRVLCG